MTSSELWHDRTGQLWRKALIQYWDRVPQRTRAIEEELGQVTPADLRSMTGERWRSFLADKYYPWKFTEGHRLARNKRLLQDADLNTLETVRERLQEYDGGDNSVILYDVMQLPGLGVAGASGLLALLHPKCFATVDRFVVEFLRSVDIPQRWEVARMAPAQLTGIEGLILIRIMSDRAQLLTATSGIEFTPRQIDMALWTVREYTADGR